MENKKLKKEDFKFQISKEGSLGLLAFGDIGLTEWRKVKNTLQNNEKKE